MCVYLERFTVNAIKDTVPLYYLFNYISKDEEGKALLLDRIKDYAIQLVNMFRISASFKYFFYH